MREKVYGIYSGHWTRWNFLFNSLRLYFTIFIIYLAPMVCRSEYPSFCVVFLLFTAGGQSHTTDADGARLQWASFIPSLCHLVIWIDRNIEFILNDPDMMCPWNHLIMPTNTLAHRVLLPSLICWYLFKERKVMAIFLKAKYQ